MGTWMKEKELAERFRVSSKTIHRWTLRGMPRVCEGKVVLYCVDDCEAWLRSRPGPQPGAVVGAVPSRTGRPRRSVDL